MSEKEVETGYNLQSSDKSGKASVNRKDIFRKNVINYFKEYCEATGIHGFRYFGESRTICEKIWWLTMFVISLILCVLCILPVYTKWEENPVIISLSTRDKPIADIPLPAITVCSESKVNSSVFDYKNAIERKMTVENLTKKEKHYLDTLSNVCDGPKKSDSAVNYSTAEEFLDIFREVSPDFSIIDCLYMNTAFFPCETFFKPILTDEGFCYTFNIIDRTELYNENVVHYKDFHDMESSVFNVYPIPALLSGAKHGLTFVLKTENKAVETMCRGSVEGYRVSIHETTSIPSPSLDFSHIPYDETFSASVTVNEITTAESIRKYSPEIRHCSFPSERKLKYFKVYNENNCILECLTNIMLRECECVLFYMPRENDTKICQEANYVCTAGVAYKATMFRISDTSKQHFDGWLIEDVKKHNCHCLPACSDISYTTTISRTKWDWKREIASGYYKLDHSFTVTNYHLSKVNVFLSKKNFIGSERNEFYGLTEFLANIGGLLGLFTGFSVLSLIEIFYFLSIRLICNIRLFGRWAGQANP